MIDSDAADSPSLTTTSAVLVDGSFEETIAALETVVGHLERGQISLEASLAWYELGLALSRRCEDLLQRAELRISTIEERHGVDSAETPSWESDES